MQNLTYISEGALKNIFNAAAVFEIIRNLATPFDKTPAYKAGLIDERGNLLKPRSKMTTEERNKVTLFDLLMFNIKKLMQKATGSQSLAPVAATLLLMREADLSTTDIDLLAETIVRDYEARSNYKTFFESEAPVNVSAAGEPSPKNIESPDILLGPPIKSVGLKVYKAKPKTYAKIKKTITMRRKLPKEISEQLDSADDFNAIAVQCEETSQTIIVDQK